MKPLLYIVLLVTTWGGFSQSKYESGMEKAFSLWEEAKLDEAANLFERIAMAEKDNWLPPYYAAQVKVIKAFNTKDETQLKGFLDSAVDFINDAKILSKDNVDLLILEAQYLTAWVAFDGQKYGMMYAGKVTELYNKALQMEPNNPRVILHKAEWDMGSARFFGKPITPYCNEIKRAVSLFETFEPAGPFYPKYGVDRALELLKTSCKEAE